MAAYIALFLSIVSTVIVTVILIRFKKLFSTEPIIKNTKIKMSQIIKDINKNANMDIDLINDATRRTRQLIKETDEKMNEFKEASQILRDLIATVDKQTRINSSIPVYKASLMDEIKPVGKVKGYSAPKEEKKTVGNVNTGKAAAINAKAYTKELPLFAEDDGFETEVEIKNKSFVAATNNDSELQEGDVIPNIVTNIVAPDNFVSKKSLDDRVMKLFGMGMEVEEIALELSCSVSEVQFIIDMQS